MPHRALIPIFAGAIFLIPALTPSADAQTERATTVKSSKSNSNDRIRGHDRPRPTARSSKSNTSNRMGGGKPKAPEPTGALTPGGY